MGARRREQLEELDNFRSMLECFDGSLEYNHSDNDSPIHGKVCAVYFAYILHRRRLDSALSEFSGFYCTRRLVTNGLISDPHRLTTARKTDCHFRWGWRWLVCSFPSLILRSRSLHLSKMYEASNTLIWNLCEFASTICCCPIMSLCLL